MKIPSPRFPVACLLAASAALAQGDELFTVTSFDGLLRAVDPLTATTVRSLQLTVGGVAVQACNGLAYDIVTGTLMAIVRMPGSGARRLAVVDRTTGICISVGALADNFAGIAFDPTGVLYGVTGDGATAAESLFTINPASAQSTLVTALGNGTEGESIAMGADGFLYHASGFGAPNVQEVFERLLPGVPAVTNVPLSGYDYDEVLSMTAITGGNLLGADLNDDLLLINGNGHVELVGALDHFFVKGMAFVPSADAQPFFRHYGSACAGNSGTMPWLSGTGLPTPGNTVTFELRFAPTSAFGILGFGFGNGVGAFPSPSCQVQILPAASSFRTVFSDAAGAAALPFALPAFLGPGDFFVQTGLLEGSGFVVSNPLQVHIR